MSEKNKGSLMTDEAIEQRMNDAIRRALSTPPSRTKDLIGKTSVPKST